MNILGPDSLVFGVDDAPACIQYFSDYGLTPVEATASGGRLEAADGTSVVIARRDDPALPPAMETGTMLRKTTYGVADRETLDAIAAELGRDREVKRLADGSIESVDDMGFVLGFQLTVRRKIEVPGEAANSPGKPARGANVLGARIDAEARPLTLSHVVYFVPDQAKAAQFYIDRLGFRCSDKFTNAGSFLRPAGTLDHHTLFLIQTPPFMKGVEHFTFHLSGPTAVLQAGYRFAAKGYQSFWGPGRHKFGSNWFWYFNSPVGCHVEYDADMDLHDDSWVPREAPMQVDESQIFLFEHREKWAPGGPPPPGQAH
jgi:catechol 2,3-dioxygenase-like lactoylglutathione lyase family enzyme